jgi:hypothetical protein
MFFLLEGMFGGKAFLNSGWKVFTWVPLVRAAGPDSGQTWGRSSRTPSGSDYPTRRAHSTNHRKRAWSLIRDEKKLLSLRKLPWYCEVRGYCILQFVLTFISWMKVKCWRGFKCRLELGTNLSEGSFYKERLSVNFAPGRHCSIGANFSVGSKICLKSGVDVMITIFCDFRQFSAKKLAFFSKTNVMIQFLHNLALFWVKNANFFCWIFSSKIFLKS